MQTPDPNPLSSSTSLTYFPVHSGLTQTNLTVSTLQPGSSNTPLTLYTQALTPTATEASVLWLAIFGLAASEYIKALTGRWCCKVKITCKSIGLDADVSIESDSKGSQKP